MFKIPDDSADEDDIPTKTYFKSRKTVSLDETVRNHGALNPTEDKQTHPANTIKSPVTTGESSSSSKVSASSTRASTIQPTKAPLEAEQATSNPPLARSTPPAPPQTSLSKAFAFMRETEFYDKDSVEKISEEKRKRMLENPPKEVAKKPDKVRNRLNNRF